MGPTPVTGTRELAGSLTAPRDFVSCPAQEIRACLSRVSRLY
jgi:hypothetical protein